MDPLDFLKIGKAWASSNQEAERRTAVGRSYYCIFNYLADFLRSKGIPLPRTADGHKKLVLVFQGSTIPAITALGGQVDDLRTQRNKADYDMSLPDFTKTTTSLLVMKAEVAKNGFDKLDKALLLKEASAYIAKIGGRL